MDSDIPPSWPGVVVVVLSVVGWFMRLENRLSNKLDQKVAEAARDLDRERAEAARSKDQDRVDSKFERLAIAMQGRDKEQEQFRNDVREALSTINLKLERLRPGTLDGQR